LYPPGRKKKTKLYDFQENKKHGKFNKDQEEETERETYG